MSRNPMYTRSTAPLAHSMGRSICLREGDEVRWVRAAWMLNDIDLRAAHGIHGAIVAMRLLPERQDAAVLRAPQARHPGPEQAHQHLLRPVTRRRGTKVALRHVLGVAREICARAPQRGVLRARGERLDARHGVGDDGVHLGRAVERPARVHARLELHPLVLERAAQGIHVRLRAPVHLQPVLHPLHPCDLHLVELAVGAPRVRGWLRRASAERPHDVRELLAVRRDVVERLAVAASLPLGRPALAHLLQGAAQRALGLDPLRGLALPPAAHHVRLRAVWTHGGVHQPPEAVVLLEGGAEVEVLAHVV
mmetsp:Transcript_35763/g.100498  ORF Transcript_35763/g.100498 Transcript_35763/m.100498 type:complete len:308 (+) Transcript_35763:289-1212(+)